MRFKEHFPELTVYTSFNPRWLQYRKNAMMRQLRATGIQGSFYRKSRRNNLVHT